MTAKPTPDDWLSSSKTTWGLLTQFAVFIFGAVGGFLLPPPGWASGAGDKTVVRLGQFVVGVLIGLIFLLVRKWNKRKHVLGWAVSALVFLALSVGAFFVYQQWLDTRTCKCMGEAVVVGTQYTEHGQAAAAEDANANCSSLLEDHACKADDVWTQDSINRSRYNLAGVYILTLPLLTICIIAVVQAIYCSQARPARG